MWRRVVAIGVLGLVGVLALACGSVAAEKPSQNDLDATPRTATPQPGDAGDSSSGSGSSGNAGATPAGSRPLPVVTDPSPGLEKPEVIYPAQPSLPGALPPDYVPAPSIPSDQPVKVDPGRSTDLPLPIGRSPVDSAPGKPPVDPDVPVSSGPPPAPGVNVPNPAPATGPAQPGLQPAPSGTKRVAAPIERVDLVVRESLPPQYGVDIQAGLPGGCAKQAGYEVERSGATFRVSVYNFVPDSPQICTAIYGMYRIGVPLTDIVSGTHYVVIVHDKTVTFTAQ